MPRRQVTQMSGGDLTSPNWHSSNRLDSDVHSHRLFAAALTHALDGRAGVVVGAHGQAHMALVNEAAVGNVDADPAPVGSVQADVGPGVAGQVGLVGGIKITANVTRRNT
jgi:hypothetical protein